MAKKKKVARRKKPEVEPEDLDEDSVGEEDPDDEREPVDLAESDESEEQDADSGADEGAEDAEAEGKTPPEEEVDEEANAEPDNQDAIAALKDGGARVDFTETGRAWRIFFYDKADDHDLAQIHGLPLIKEVWVMGTRITAEAAEQLRKRLPKAKVFS